MAKPLTLKFLTMNNVLDPSDLDPQKKGECVDLCNADTTARGGVSRRNGYTLIQAGSFRGGWSDSTRAYVAQGNGIYRFDGTSFTLLNVLLNSAGPVVFCAVNDIVVFSSQSELGIVGESGLTAPAAEFEEPMAPGLCLAFFGSRLYSAKDNVLRCSKPYSVEVMDSRRNRAFIARDAIRLALPVNDGMYVATATETFYMAGGDPFAGGDGWSPRPVASCGGIRGTGVVTDASKLRFLQNVSGPVALWDSPNGRYAGFNGGQVINLSEGKVSNASGSEGAAMVREIGGMIHYLSTFRATETVRNQY